MDQNTATSGANLDRPDRVTTDKSFFVKERGNLYAEWCLALWRELFQNSTDAGATAIRISVTDDGPRGSFGRPAAPQKVTRIVFEDNGCGMSERILNDVYFRMGATTKNDETMVGGFGRARLMTCFSQVRYGIHTQDRVVEGDGAEYKNYSREQAIEAFTRWAEIETGRADGGEATSDENAAWHRESAFTLRAEAERLRNSPESFKGCRVEIDLDPKSGDLRTTSDVAGMLSQLDVYLKQSELQCSVAVNGVEVTKPKPRLPSRRMLLATFKASEIDPAWRDGKIKIIERPDGEFDVGFAKIRLAPEDAIPKDGTGMLIVRVSGASMYSEKLSGKQTVFVEIEPALARIALTANRDGLKGQFADSMADFKRTLATDSQQALKPDMETEFTLLRGGLGAKVARLAKIDISSSTAAAAATAGKRGRGIWERIRAQDHQVTYSDSDWSWREFLKNETDNLDRDTFTEFCDSLKKIDDVELTFLAGYADKESAKTFLTTLKNSGMHRAMVYASGSLLGYMSDHLHLRKIAKEEEAQAAHKDRLRDLNDIPILKDGVSPPPDRFDVEETRSRRAKIVAAARRHDPRTWDPTSGRGMQPRKVLAAWQTAVDNVVQLMLEIYPKTDEFSYSSGWVFSHPQWRYHSLSGDYTWIGTSAMLKTNKTADAKTVHFLLNPLDHENDFRMKFNPSNAEDRDKLLTLAAHEAGHVLSPNGHDDAFAEVLTRLSERLTVKERRRIHKEMEEAVRMVGQIYSAGRTRIVPLDDDVGLRPAERFMVSMASETAAEAIEPAADGTTSIRTNIVDEREAEFVGSDPQPMIAPAI